MNFISSVERVEGVPKRVEATFGNITVAFVRRSGKPVEVSRRMNAMVYSSDEMRLIKGVYPEILRQVGGVFGGVK